MIFFPTRATVGKKTRPLRQATGPSGGILRVFPTRPTADVRQPPPLRRADDGLDGPALPRLPSAAGAERAAVYGDGACAGGDPRRPRAAARFRAGRASGRAAVGRQRSG